MCRIQSLAFIISSGLINYAVASDNQGWVNFELKGGHVTIPSLINGIEGHSIIDTGASLIAVNKQAARHAGLSPSSKRQLVKGVTGTLNRRTYRDVPTNIFGADLNFEDVTEMTFGSESTQLLLGGPLLRMFIFQFDYHNERLRALPRNSVDLKKLSNIKSRRDNRNSRLPVVKVILGTKKSVWLTMDTGNSGGLLIRRKVAKNLGWLDEYELTDHFVQGVNGTAAVQSFNVPVMHFGPFEMENVRVTVPANGVHLPVVDEKGKLAEGLLGFDVLKHFVLTIDYKKGHVHVALPETLQVSAGP